MSVWWSIVIASALVGTPIAVLLMLRKEEPMRDGLMEIKCYTCDKRLFVSERNPHPGVQAHFDTDEHRRNLEEDDG